VYIGKLPGSWRKKVAMKNAKIKIALVVTGTLISVMTISDWYYSQLEREYPVLEDMMAIHGIITHRKVHWKHSFISLNSGVKVNIPPPTTERYEPTDFHNLIEVGDSLFKESTSDKITLVKNGREYYFWNNVQ
jgi:hypothetical protein